MKREKWRLEMTSPNPKAPYTYDAKNGVGPRWVNGLAEFQRWASEGVRL